MALIKVDGIKFKGSYKLKGGLIFVNWKEALDLRLITTKKKWWIFPYESESWEWTKCKDFANPYIVPVDRVDCIKHQQRW